MIVIISNVIRKSLVYPWNTKINLQYIEIDSVTTSQSQLMLYMGKKFCSLWALYETHACTLRAECVTVNVNLATQLVTNELWG
jgi:hypothetical protein